MLIVGAATAAFCGKSSDTKSVEKATLIDIDEEVINASKRFLPDHQRCPEDPRADVKPMTPWYISKPRKKNSTSPSWTARIPGNLPPDSLNPLLPRYPQRPKKGRNGRCPDGITLHRQERRPGTPSGDEFRLSPSSGCTGEPMPTYPSGMWTYTVGSKNADPSRPFARHPRNEVLHTSDIHRASFVLPPFVIDLLK